MDRPQELRSTATSGYLNKILVDDDGKFRDDKILM